MYVRPYNRQTEETDISHPETRNGLAEISVDKLANKEIFIPFDYLEPQRSYRCGWPWKSHFTNDFTNQTAMIFISHGKQADYELTLQL